MPSPNQDGGGGGFAGAVRGLCGEEVGEQASWEGPALVLSPAVARQGRLFSSRAVLRG